jgi:class 3 adenylate cyclase
LGRWDDQIKIGLNSGEVVVGRIGDDLRMGFAGELVEEALDARSRCGPSYRPPRPDLPTRMRG